MGYLIKSVMAINFAVIILQICVLGFEIYRWNEIVGSVFSIVVAFLGYLPSTFGENKERWFIGVYALLLVVDMIFQLVNMILLICFQWVVIQYCIHLNVSVDISDYGGVACNDWWHFGKLYFKRRTVLRDSHCALIANTTLTPLSYYVRLRGDKLSGPCFNYNYIVGCHYTITSNTSYTVFCYITETFSHTYVHCLSSSKPRGSSYQPEIW